MSWLSSLVRIWKYLPVIWRDRDWDYEYLLILMDFKLERMYKHFQSITPLAPEEAKRMCQEISYTRKLLQRQETWKTLEKYLVETYGEVVFTCTKSGPGIVLSHFTRSRLDENTSSLTRRRARELERELWEERHKAEERDWQKLGNVIRYKLKGWWD